MGSAVGVLIILGTAIICFGKVRRKKQLRLKEAVWKAKGYDSGDARDNYTPGARAAQQEDAEEAEKRNFSPYVDQKPDAGAWGSASPGSATRTKPIDSFEMTDTAEQHGWSKRDGFMSAPPQFARGPKGPKSGIDLGHAI